MERLAPGLQHLAPNGDPVPAEAAARQQWCAMVMGDHLLPMGARVLGFWIADSMNMGTVPHREGFGWRSQETLAYAMGQSLQSIGRHAKELAGRGYVLVRRGKPTNLYRPTWPRFPFQAPTNLSGVNPSRSARERPRASKWNGQNCQKRPDKTVRRDLTDLSANLPYDLPQIPSLSAVDFNFVGVGRASASAVEAPALARPHAGKAELAAPPQGGFACPSASTPAPDPKPPAKPPRSLREIAAALLDATPTGLQSKTFLDAIRIELRALLMCGGAIGVNAERAAAEVIEAITAGDQRPTHEILKAAVEALLRQADAEEVPF